MGAKATPRTGSTELETASAMATPRSAATGAQARQRQGEAPMVGTKTNPTWCGVTKAPAMAWELGSGGKNQEPTGGGAPAHKKPVKVKGEEI